MKSHDSYKRFRVPLFHLLVIVPYLGWISFGNDKRIFDTRLVQIPFVFMIYLYLWYLILLTPKKSSLWLWIHVSVFLPLILARLLYPVGGFRVKLLSAITFAVFGYHLKWIIVSIMTEEK